MSAARPRETGLLTDRLSEKELRRWQEIEMLVFAEDESGPLQPTIRGLWEWIETSGHAVYIELTQTHRISSCTAGNFRLEYFDPRGERFVRLVGENPLDDVARGFVGVAAALDEPRFDAGVGHRPRDRRAAAMHDDRPHADRFHEHDVDQQVP